MEILQIVFIASTVLTILSLAASMNFKGKYAIRTRYMHEGKSYVAEKDVLNNIIVSIGIGFLAVSIATLILLFIL